MTPRYHDTDAAGSEAATLFRLQNAVQHYDWGSRTDIPRLLGTVPSGKPEAELWLGAHPSAPSLASPIAGSGASVPDSPDIAPSSSLEIDAANALAGTPLDELIQRHPVAMLGQRVSDDFGPRLPYLMKVLAADRALSLQVHPPPHLARAGFNRESRLGVPVGAPGRSFHDSSHKPEMVVAVTEFHALAGLRAPRVILRMLDGLDGDLFDIIRDPITANPNPKGLRAAFVKLLGLRDAAETSAALSDAISAVSARAAAGSQYEVADQTAVELAAQYPGDVGALAPYLLNRVTLQPGEAIFLGDGEPHAYIKGMGVEIMANSDNVLRAGLTSKHVDADALLESMAFNPGPAVRPTEYLQGLMSQSVTYRAPVDEFALTMLDLHVGEPLMLPPSGPRTLIVLDGELTLTYGGGVGLGGAGGVGSRASSREGRPMTGRLPRVTGLPLTTVRLARGESLFIPDGLGAAELTGSGQAATAWVP